MDHPVIFALASRFIHCCALGCFLFPQSQSVAQASSPSDRPNVVVILTDDQGWGDLSLHGNKNIQTPNLDRLAKSGTRFDRFFVSPVCAPTRAEFLTGRYHPRGGVNGVTSGAERLNLDETTIAQSFQAAGYRTAAIGKWHNGTQFPYHPNARGFREFYGFCSGHWGDYFSPELDRNGKLVKGNGYLVEDFTDDALEFIERNVAREFFLYLALPTPHSPMQVPDRYWNAVKNRKISMRSDQIDEEDIEFTRAATAMVECIDDNVGRVISALEELNLRENTIVIFFCDNGPNSFRWNGGMKGKKGSTDEGGVRSPLFISWPETITANRLVPQIAGAIDLYPTLLDLADVPGVHNKPLDGTSLAPLILGKASSIPNRRIFSHWNNKISLRTQRYRLDHQGHLFDMVIDPYQKNDISDDQPALAEELGSYVNEWKTEVLSQLPETPRPFTIGYAGFPTSRLPARDAELRGSLKRSAKAPNCSFITNWTSPEDSVSWNVETLSLGDYSVEAHYTCPGDSVGTELRLQVGGKELSASIIEANDPPAIGTEHDRVPRVTQSLMKDFKPLNLGTVRLQKGLTTAELSASFPDGTGDIEISMLTFTREN